MTIQDDREREEREREVQVVISDKRHSRDLEGPVEEEPSPPEPTHPLGEHHPDAVAEEPVGLHPPELLDFPEDAPTGHGHELSEHLLADGAGNGGGIGEGMEPPLSAEEQEAAAMEMAQLRQVFAGGLSRYLQAQLGLLLNFALIGLGRAPDPTSGIVTQNLAQARLAIDVLEFLVLRLEPDLHPQDKVQLKQLVADLKYAYMQQAQAPPVVGDIPGKA